MPAIGAVLHVLNPGFPRPSSPNSVSEGQGGPEVCLLRKCQGSLARSLSPPLSGQLKVTNISNADSLRPYDRAGGSRPYETKPHSPPSDGRARYFANQLCLRNHHPFGRATCDVFHSSCPSARAKLSLGRTEFERPDSPYASLEVSSSHRPPLPRGPQAAASLVTPGGVWHLS